MLSDKSTNRQLKALAEEDLNVLSGKRPNASAKAAVRREDVNALIHITEDLKSKSVNAVPTAQQYNDLRSDLAMVHEALVAIGRKMKAYLR